MRQEQRHITALDGIRGFALLIVFLFHALGDSLRSDSVASRYALRFVSMGWVGVDLFFVLSGFLITTILLSVRQADNYFSVFYIRRALRIFPLYYAVLIGSLVVMGGHFSWPVLLAFALNLSNLPTAFHPLAVPYLAHFWSLAIEEQFYFLWPAIVYKLRSRTVAYLCIGVIAGEFILRNLPSTLTVNQHWPEFVYRFTLFRLDTLCAGALLAILVKRWPAIPTHPLVPRCLFLFGACLFLTVGLSKSLFSTAFVRFGYTGMTLSFGSLLLLALNPKSLTSKVFNNRFFRKTGKYSYCFYLIHPFLVNLVSNHRYLLNRLLPRMHLAFVPQNLVTLALVGVEFAVIFGVCALSFKYFEEPIQRLKSRYPYSMNTQ